MRKAHGQKSTDRGYPLPTAAQRGAGLGLGAALGGGLGVALAPAGEEEGFVFVGAGKASGFALAGAAAPPLGVEDTGVTARPGAVEVEPAGGGGAAGFGSGWPAACPAGADAGWARAAVTLGELPPSNSSGPALARISFTWPGFVRNGECGKSSPGRCFRTSLINCIQMGSATRAPSSLSPSVWWSSKPRIRRR